MYIFSSIPWLTECLCDWHTEGTKGEVIIICLKIYKDNYLLLGEKKSRTCNK